MELKYGDCVAMQRFIDEEGFDYGEVVGIGADDDYKVQFYGDIAASWVAPEALTRVCRVCHPVPGKAKCLFGPEVCQ